MTGPSTAQARAKAPGPAATRRLRTLLVEDSPDDAALLLRALGRAGYEPQAERVETPEGMRAALARETWDVIIADYNLPRFSGPGALALLQATGLDVPLIITSGGVSEETAVQAMKAGASDYVPKSNLARLGVAVERETREAASRAAQRRSERELERLREADEARARMVSAATHELRNPMGPIRLELHMLARGKLGALNERQLHAVAMVERNIIQLNSLIGDLLDVARLQAGRLTLRPAPCDLAALVRDAAASFQVAASEAGACIAVEAPEPLPGHADSKRITQVLFNLIGNAVKFTPAGGSIDVAARREGDRALLRVCDSGVGLSAEGLAALFQPFSQVANPRQAEHSGTGLGLYICKGIVEQHGGRIRAESRGEGRGSEFVVELPLAEVGP